MLTSLIAAMIAQTPPGLGPVVQPLNDTPAVKRSQNKKSGSTTISAQATGRPIKGIAFKGVDAPAEVAAAANAFIGRPATREVLLELAGALSRAYEKTDIALYTVAIPDQNFAEDSVVVMLSEGSIDRVAVKNGKAGAFPLLTSTAQPLVGQKPLSRGRYERQLSLMQAIPGLKFDTQFANPDGDDTLTLTLDPKQKRSRFGLGVNNWGPDLVGDVVIQGSADFYRLLQDGDQLNFSGVATRDFKRYRQLGASYGMPIGASGLRLTASGAWLQTKPRRTNISGTAKLASVGLSYPILRRFKRIADVSFTIDGIDSRNAAFGNVIASENTRAARLGASYASADDKQQLSGQIVVSRGLGILGARTIEPISQRKFMKVSGNATVERNFGKRVAARAHVEGQLSRSRLPAAELFAAGGPSVGRAFDNALLTGDRGVGGFVELAYRPVTAANFAKSEVYLFADGAKLATERRGIFPGQRFDLASAGGGVRVRLKDLIELGLEGAKVIDRPYPGYSDDQRVSFYYKLSL